MSAPSVRHHDVRTSGDRLHVAETGEGPPVLLLHGFPDFWYGWRHQLPALAEAGFWAVAPDLRGYNLSKKPRGVRSYRVEALVDDLAGLIRWSGAERASVVGYDWGGVVAWYLAMLHPQMIDRLAILKAPHPAAFARELRTPDQLLRSWYAFLIQLPLLPEALLRAGNFALLRRTLRAESRPGVLSDEDLARYSDALAQPGALREAIHYYRAAGWRGPRGGSPVQRIATPTLLLWGERDPHLTVRLTEGLERWVVDLCIHRFPDAGHWVQIDELDAVNRRLLSFLSERTG